MEVKPCAWCKKEAVFKLGLIVEDVDAPCYLINYRWFCKACMCKIMKILGGK